MRKLRLLVLLVGILSVAWSDASGQILRGRVASSAAGSAALATVLVNDAAGREIGRTRADSAGSFAVDLHFFGKVQVVVQQIGFSPTRPREVTIDPTGSTVVDLALGERLPTSPTALPTVSIRGEMRPVPYGLEDVYKRGSLGHGSFFTREDIVAIGARDLQPLFARIPGINWNDKGFTFARCQPGINRSDMSKGIKGGMPAKVQIYVDGTLMRYDADTGRFGMFMEGVLRSVPITSIQAVEVYRGMSEIPPEFLSDACAVIAIWTRRQ